MLNKKQMLALMLGASAMGASYAASKQTEGGKITIEDFQEKMDDLPDFLNAFAAKAKSGDFKGIGTDLSDIKLEPAVQFLVENTDNIKEKINSYVKVLQEQISGNTKATADEIKFAQDTLKAVEKKLALLHNLKVNLETIAPYANLGQYQAIIEKALTAANNDKEFRDKLQSTISDTIGALKKLLATIDSINATAVQNTLDSAKDLYADYQSGDLTLKYIKKEVTPGINDLRNKLLPVAPAIAAELSGFILEVYALLTKVEARKLLYVLPDGVVPALLEINDKGFDLQKAFEDLNPKIDTLKKRFEKFFN